MSITITLTIEEYDQLRALKESGEKFNKMKSELKINYPGGEIHPSTPIGLVRDIGPRVAMTPTELYKIVEKYFL
jgi:hypothetical protein